MAHTSAAPPESLVHAITKEFVLSGKEHWRPLSGGRTNFTWHVSGGTCPSDLVVKLYQGPALNPLFPNDPQAEARLLRFLANKPFTPRLLVSLKCEAGWCNVYSHVPGVSWQEDAGAVGKLVGEVHDTLPALNLRRSPNGSAELAKQIRSIQARCEAGVALAQQEPAEIVAPCTELVLLHGDVVPGNLIRNQQGLHLIDWQCPAIGDPCEDIAIFLSPAMQHLYRGSPLRIEEEQDFFAAYDRPEIRQRYYNLKPWYHQRMAAYCQWQSENGRPDYAAARDLELAEFQRSLSP